MQTKSFFLFFFTESGHGILGKYAQEKEEAAKEEAAGGTWAGILYLCYI
jgi:hypothetical protein